MLVLPVPSGQVRTLFDSAQTGSPATARPSAMQSFSCTRQPRTLPGIPTNRNRRVRPSPASPPVPPAKAWVRPAQDRLDSFPSNNPEPVLNPLLMDISSCQRFSEEHAAWAERRAAQVYLHGVVEGRIQLAAYDPARNSIVEMIGTYSQDTSTVITYVPGTTTNEASFYGGGPQGISNHLVQSDRTGGSVAFVYKGSEFPDGVLIEAFAVEAKSDDFVAGSSPVLAEFQAAVELEGPGLPRPWESAIAGACGT